MLAPHPVQWATTHVGPVYQLHSEAVKRTAIISSDNSNNCVRVKNFSYEELLFNLFLNKDNQLRLFLWQKVQKPIYCNW